MDSEKEYEEYINRIRNEELTVNEAQELIYYMCREIRETELEIIALRYVLSTCMSDNFSKECMRDDIFSNTRPEFIDRTDYQKFVEQYMRGKDLFNTRAYQKRMIKISKGYIDSYHCHPNLYLETLKDHLQVKDGYIRDID